MDENIIGRNPDPHERVDMNGRPPFDIFENFNVVMFEDFVTYKVLIAGLDYTDSNNRFGYI